MQTLVLPRVRYNWKDNPGAPKPFHTGRVYPTKPDRLTQAEWEAGLTEMEQLIRMGFRPESLEVLRDLMGWSDIQYANWLYTGLLP